MPELAKHMDKPAIGVDDGGRLCDPLVDELIAKAEGMAVFGYRIKPCRL